jgi:ArsR family transcriptional regulator
VKHIALEFTDVSACAPSGLVEPLPRENAEALAGVLKAVADPTRLQLIAMINASPNGEACGCNLTSPLGLSQPTVSHHLKVLSEAGIIQGEKRGTWIWYSVNQDRWSELAKLFS